MRIYERLKSWTLDNVLLVLILLLGSVILSRLAPTLVNYTNTVAAPEEFVSQANVAGDFWNGVIKPAILMKHGENFYLSTGIYGPSLSVITIPLLEFAQNRGLCFEATCTSIFYQWLLLAAICGYAFFIFWITHTHPEARPVFLLFLFAFLLGIPGSMGLVRGNVDILYSLLFGIVLVLAQSKTDHKTKTNLFVPIIVGILLGFLTNSKLFFLPFSILIILTTPGAPAIAAVSILTFFAFLYLPHVYGAPSTLTQLLDATKNFEQSVTFTTYDSINFNHSFTAFTSLATDAVSRQSWHPNREYKIIGILSGILFLFTFVLPIVMDVPMRLLKKIPRYVRHLLAHRCDNRLQILAIVYVIAFINLVPEISFNYRLYYSLPLLFILYLDTKHRSTARWYLILSLCFLGIKGLWVLMTQEPKGMTIFDIRATNVFVVLHFFFLIKAAIAHVLDYSSRE
ncbi:hypothetical protein A2Z00_02075 [Candidatus Gottesmanbacteria bacterium RBG_13_45_10]|uniref:Uncharacterized protein n=1 Tax=Candidatus Gottesmanbacteria bacterium RBG_13_45_10 TaxID=1798370 RepID=A0A1F5ZHV6_9BACT|nr:MAG: hypothetical protein A2Z00_02075 [Candidatus Gottesmanbacteria bacterium RBG_13_45_10]